MISILFNFNPIRALSNPEKRQLFMERFDFLEQVPEMRTVSGAIPVSAVVETLAGMGRVKTLIDSLDQRGAIEIIGVWRTAVNEEGIEILEQHPNYTFNFTLYKAHLRNVFTYDENGVPTSSRRPTDAEVLVTPVNKFMGMPDRILQ